jgi:transposase-like protein
MPKKNPPTGTDADLNLVSLLPLFTDEDKAREFVEAKRWRDGKFCPHCGCAEVYTLTAKPGSKSPVRPGVYKCSMCREQFTVRVGTIFEDSKLPISKWLMAIHLMTSSKKGVSSHQIARELDITQKSAWFLCHRIREAMKLEPMAGLLGGAVEIDETYVGGKPRFPGTSKRGRGTSKKAVVALVERDGRVRSFPVDRVDSATLHAAAMEHVDQNAKVFTDELASYNGLGEHFAAHHTINHGAKKYVAVADDGTKVTTNTAESYFALLKRGHYGIFHHYSKKHTHRYCNEFSFRWDHRKVSDGERMIAAIEGAEGKRLMYRKPTEGISQ